MTLRVSKSSQKLFDPEPISDVSFNIHDCTCTSMIVLVNAPCIYLQFLIGFNRGIVILWNANDSQSEKVFNSSQVIPLRQRFFLFCPGRVFGPNSKENCFWMKQFAAGTCREALCACAVSHRLKSATRAWLRPPLVVCDRARSYLVDLLSIARSVLHCDMAQLLLQVAAQVSDTQSYFILALSTDAVLPGNFQFCF